MNSSCNNSAESGAARGSGMHYSFVCVDVDAATVSVSAVARCTLNSRLLVGGREARTMSVAPALGRCIQPPRARRPTCRKKAHYAKIIVKLCAINVPIALFAILVRPLKLERGKNCDWERI